jgi:hypothetical protein
VTSARPGAFAGSGALRAGTGGQRLRLSVVNLTGPVLIFAEPLDARPSLTRRLWAWRRKLLTALHLAPRPEPKLFLVRQDRFDPITLAPKRAGKAKGAMRARLITFHGQKLD